MLQRVKQNKGYYGYLLGETLAGIPTTLMTLALVNLPAALVCLALNTTITLATGIAAAPRLSKAPPKTSIGRPPKEKKSIGKSLKRTPLVIKNFFKYTLADPEVVVGSSSAGASSSLLFQCMVAAGNLLTAHTLLFATGITGIAMTGGLAAIGVIGAVCIGCMVAGKLEKWRGLSRFFSSTFHAGEVEEPPPPLTGWKKKVHDFFDKPFMQKAKRGLMIFMSTESAIFSIVAGVGIVTAAVTGVATAPAIVAIPAALYAAKWALANAWNLSCNARLIYRDIKAFRKNRQAKKELKKKAALGLAAPLVPVTPPPKVSLLQRLKNTFGKVARKGGDIIPPPAPPYGPAGWAPVAPAF